MKKNFNLYKHQEDFLATNPNKAILAWQVGVGKSYCIRKWIELRPEIKFLVVVPKKIKGKTIIDLEGLNVVVKTKEEVKKYSEPCSGFIFDEALHLLSPLFTRQRSKLTEHCYDYIKKYNIQHVLLASATILGSSPHSIHTAIAFLNKGIGWKDYQKQTYSLVSRPYSSFPIWEKAKNWRLFSLKYAIENDVYFAKMSDVIDIPEQTNSVVKLKTLPVKDFLDCENQAQEWHKKARQESNDGTKTKWILNYITDKTKVLISCRYTSSIEMLEKEISKERFCLTLTGATKNAEEVVRIANENPDCVLICQSDVSEGWEVPHFSELIFFNLSFKHSSFIQTSGRVLRISHMHSVHTTHLIGGKLDNEVYKSIAEANKDFELIC
jgi:superfamily II DNA or RNA helicase